MKAIRQLGYGRPDHVLRLEQVAAPVAADDQVMVRVRASSINSADCRAVLADPFLVRLMGGLRSPKDPEVGRDVCGVVEAVGGRVTGLEVGDEVYGHAAGALGELVVGRTFVAKPANVSFEQAAAVPTAGSTALQAVRDHGAAKPGDKVLVNGAGGGVGTFAVQVAAALGAQVTAVTGADKLEMVRTLGATTVLDRATDDFTRNRGAYDVIVDIGGDHSLGASLKALKPGGRLVMVGAHKGVLRRVIAGSLRRRFLKQPAIFFVANVNTTDLVTLREWVEAGKVKPVIDRTYPLERTADAVAYAEGQQAAGKVIVTVPAGIAGEP
jgi:NADPH:quinone reductase-like Zn-dependent oxidoreductase